MQNSPYNISSHSIHYLLVCIAIFIAACNPVPPHAAGPRYADLPAVQSAPLYRFAVHPLYNPSQLNVVYQPLIDYMNRHIDGVNFQLEASRDYAAFEVKFRARQPQFILPNPWQTLAAIKSGFSVIAIAGDADDFKGIFLIRRDSAISTPSDVKGKVVSYPSPTALAATILPQYYLHHHGIDVNRDIDNRYVGSQESSIMHVLLKQSDIGATWPVPWRHFQKEHPQEAAQMRVIWETPTLINNSVMVRNDVPPTIREQVSKLLTGLALTAEGRTLLQHMETARFQAANDADYAPVRELIGRFEREVRPVESQK